MTYRELLAESVEKLQNNGDSDAEYDCFLLLEYVFGITRSSYLLKKNDAANKEKAEEFFELIDKRCSGMPVQHITGSQCFMGLDFKVNENVLIPRFDTEILVSWIIEAEQEKDIAYLDMCTGSGCIAVSLKKYKTEWTGYAADISKEALEIAKENASYHKTDIDFTQSDLFDAINQKYDIIVSNPPYIPTEVVRTLEVMVKDYEPELALDGGVDGLDFYRRIISAGSSHLKKGGRIYFEIGYDQGVSVPQLLEEAGYRDIVVKKDLAGLDRCVRAVY